MTKSIQIPDCYYPKEAALVTPSSQTPNHTIYLSNLDDQRFLRFSIKYLYLYKRCVGVESLKASLSKVLEEYYPLAGRLRANSEDAEKLELDCNGEGALFAEAFVNISVDEFLEASQRPNASWRKLLYRVEASSFIGIPPLVVQAMHQTLACTVYEAVVAYLARSAPVYPKLDRQKAQLLLHHWVVVMVSQNWTL